MATKQQVAKPKKKQTKRLRDGLPKRGFEFKIGQNLFASDDDAASFRATLESVTPNLSRHEVDDALADIMKKAKEVKRPGDSDHGVVIERARKRVSVRSPLASRFLPKIP